MLRISSFNIQNDFSKYNINKSKEIYNYLVQNKINILGLQEVYSKIMEHCHSRKVKIVWISSNEVDNSLLSDEDIYIYTNEGKLQDVNLRTKISSITIIQLIIELLIQHKFN